jgi:dTDP-4-dehydrorhamnose reductase
MAVRILITGAAGQVGRCLAARSAARGYEVAGLTHADLDITDAEAVRRHVRRGDLVVNCAALTNVDTAEAEPAAAHAINAVGPGNLAAACAAGGARLIHISTDYVFDGSLRRPYEITDPCRPVNVYGRSKLDGELAVHAALPSAQVVRTSWVYTGADGSDFVALMRRLAATDGCVDMVADQTGSPTYVEDLVGALLELAGGGISAPTLHVANDGAVSRFEQARAVFALLGADPERVRPVATEAVPRPARRPAYSALSMAGSAAAGLTRLRPWHDALVAALAVPTGHGPITSTP